MTLDPNVEKHLIKKIAKEAVEAATAIYDYLPDADTCIVTLNGPDGPLSECTVLVGNSAAESIPMKTDQYGNFRAPVGAPEFKVDAIGLVEATVAAITDNTPRVVNMVALSCGAFVLACLLAAVPATAGEATHSLADGRPMVCQCGPECDCGYDCQCVAAQFSVKDATATAEAAKAGGNLRRTALRMFLKSKARQARRSGDTELAAKLAAAIEDDETLADVDAALMAEPKIGYREVGEFPDGLLKILTWLRDNSDWLIQFIKQIVDILAAHRPLNLPSNPAALLDAPAGWSEWPLALAC